VQELLKRIDDLALEKAHLSAEQCLLGPRIVPDDQLEAAIFDVDGDGAPAPPPAYNSRPASAPPARRDLG
jgi:hypothetical protein